MTYNEIMNAIQRAEWAGDSDEVRRLCALLAPAPAAAPAAPDSAPVPAGEAESAIVPAQIPSEVANG